jgi:serine/threonine protein kinase
MAQYGSEPDDGGSLAGSPANASLTGDKLRRRPAHSRKPSVESVDLENDTLLPAALERMQILSGATGLSAPGAGRPPRRLRGPTAEGASARESVASADEAVARDGSSGESSRAAEVTSAEKPAVGSGDKIRAIVASGGALYDKPDGSRGYRGGDTRLVSIRRGATFDALSALLDDDDDDDASIAKRKKRQKVYYRDPNDGVTLLRVARDADIDEMFEEWDRRMATLVRDAFAHASNANPEKLKVYVVEKSGSADSEPATSRDASREQSQEQLTKMKSSASASVGLQNVPSAELTLVHRLGGGAFGEVHLALWRGAEVAVKFTRARRERRERREKRERVDSEHDVSEDSEDEDGEEEALDAREALASRESFLKEARTMAALHHPNVVFVYGVVDDGDRLGIVEEFMRSGSLRRLLNLHVREAKERAAERSSETNGEGEGEGEGEGDAAAPTRSKKPTGPRGFGKRHLSATVRARCALDVARGMAYLHSRRFVHFDLKCDNVLTARQLGVAGGVTCKVADFGLSKQQRGTVNVGGDGGGADVEPRDKNADDKAREFTSGIASQRGTLPWTAPELFSDPAGATESVDAYSFGVCMWELWTCDVPFRDEREQSVVWGIMTGKRPEVPSGGPGAENEPVPGYRDLMTALWREDARARPTFDETVAILEDALAKATSR